MKKQARIFLLLLGCVTMASSAQNNPSNSPPPLVDTNIYQAGVQSFITNGASPANIQPTTNVNENAGVASAQPPATNQQGQSTQQKPAVHVTVDGTVLTPDQKLEIEQRLKDIPGVVMINNRIHVVGEISEPAGAVTTNFVRTNAPPKRQQKHKPVAF